MRKVKTGASLIGAVALALMVEAPAAEANTGYGRGEKEGKTYSAEAGVVHYSGNGSGGSKGGGGNLSVPGGDWSPPPCWYAPTYTPKQLKEKVDASPYSLTGQDPYNKYVKEETDRDIRHMYSEGEYKDYNLDKQGEGKFWAAVPNPGERDA
ncbi:hypothetical protein ITI46_33315, partial [Streptomyces oryzae]|nr:hypothetical protein [Streptomyces oryzae]